MVLGDAFSKLEMLVWILNRISRSITWSLFTLTVDRQFARSGHMVRNKLCWDADIKGKPGWTGTSSFVLKVASQHNLLCTM